MLLDPLSALIRLNELESTPRSKNEAMAAQEEREIERCRETLSSGLIEKYEKCLERHGDSAVVPVERGSCSGCNLTIPPAGLEEVAEDVHVCCHCDRLVYDPEFVFDFV